MAKTPPSSNTPPEAVISIIGVGMTLEGDSETDGSLRVEGTIRGNVRAGKSVVIGRDGFVDGSIYTQDAVIAGRVSGGIHAVSRLELQATSEVSGEIEAPRMQVEEGAKVQGQVAVGEPIGEGGLPQKFGGTGRAELGPESKAADDAGPESKAVVDAGSESKEVVGPELGRGQAQQPGADEPDAVQPEHSQDR